MNDNDCVTVVTVAGIRGQIDNINTLIFIEIFNYKTLRNVDKGLLCCT